ncbi:MAG: hypothetical protein WCI73_04585, partial [Phycisphaerae bacterium]
MRDLSRPHLFAALLLSLAIVTALCVLAPQMKPLRPGTSADFWYAATGINLGTSWNDRPWVAFERDRFVLGTTSRFYVYEDILPFESITLEDAAVDFPRVQRELERRAALHDSKDSVAAGYAKWRATLGSLDPKLYPNTLPNLVEFINFEAGAESYRRGVDDLDFRQGLKHASKAARFYWVCFIFELVYLVGLVWFVFWPHIRRAATWRKILHLAALPFLIYLPYWFDYCNPGNNGFPFGGILYPYTCLPAGFMPVAHKWEFKMLAHFPPFLEVITQGRAVAFTDYPDLRYLRPYEMGIVNVFLLSAVLTAAAASWNLGPYIWRKLFPRPQGFPVLNVHPRDP